MNPDSRLTQIAGLTADARAHAVEILDEGGHTVTTEYQLKALIWALDRAQYIVRRMTASQWWPVQETL